jgi:hypothetical protein
MDEKWEKISTLDLASVRRKFIFKKGMWWHTLNSTDRVEQAYRRFIYLIVMNPGKTVVPWSRDLDDFWHEHILDTARYARDCNEILGSFIHHDPNLPEGSAAHSIASDETEAMYVAAFKERLQRGHRKRASLAGCAALSSGDGGSTQSHGGGGHGGHGCGGHGGGHGCGGHGCGGHGGGH